MTKPVPSRGDRLTEAIIVPNIRLPDEMSRLDEIVVMVFLVCMTGIVIACLVLMWVIVREARKK